MLFLRDWATWRTAYGGFFCPARWKKQKLLTPNLWRNTIGPVSNPQTARVITDA
jgi:hypothetical protein